MRRMGMALAAGVYMQMAAAAAAQQASMAPTGPGRDARHPYLPGSPPGSPGWRPGLP